MKCVAKKQWHIMIFTWEKIVIIDFWENDI